jgi:hypothetical protein
VTAPTVPATSGGGALYARAVAARHMTRDTRADLTRQLVRARMLRAERRRLQALVTAYGAAALAAVRSRAPSTSTRAETPR